MKPFFFILIILSLTSCVNQEEELEGLWVLDYEIFEGGVKSYELAHREVFSFEKDILTIKGFSCRSFSSDSYEYSVPLGKESFSFSTGYFKHSLVGFSRDSLLFDCDNSSSDSDCRQLVLKPVRELARKTEMKNSDFVGKAFRFQWPYFTDSLEFVNDSLLLRITTDKRRDRYNQWELDHFKGVDFLVLQNEYCYLPVLYNRADSQFTFSGGKLFMEEMAPIFEKENLLGTWEITLVELDSLRQISILDPDFLRVESIPCPNQEDVRLVIEEDSIAVSLCGETNKWKYQINTLGNFLLPEIADNRSKDFSFVIKELKAEEMILMNRRLL